MNRKLLITLFCFLLLLIANVNAADEPLEFDDAAQEQRFKDLIEDLRCLVCQNQSLADSHAPLAEDLRLEVYRKLRDGDNNADIIDYLVARYGDFVLYRPPFKATTALLWFSPLIFLAIGVWIAISFLRKQQQHPLSAEDLKYADKLLDDEGPDNNK